jgi:hypothetical protein
MKLTPWYHGDQKPMPDRVGVYERKYSYPYPYYWWDGEKFGTSYESIEKCATMKMRYGPAIWQDLPWRGVEK